MPLTYKNLVEKYSVTEKSGMSVIKVPKDTDLTGINLNGADLTKANLTGANLTNATFINANLTGVHLTNANLTGADLEGADLTDVYLNGANFTNANLTGADLEGADLTDAHLNGANFTKAHLKIAHLQYVDMDGNHFDGAYLEDADLEGAFLSGAHFIGADLTYANLEAAHLEGADFTDANLTGADLTEADLTDTIFTDTIGLEELQTQLNPLQVHQSFNRVLLGADTIIKLLGGCDKNKYHYEGVESDKHKLLQNMCDTFNIKKIDKHDNFKAKLKTVINAIELGHFATKIHDVNGNKHDITFNEFICASMIFASKQSDKYKQLFITSFVEDCVQAYDGNSGMSCSKGIFERFILSIPGALMAAEMLDAPTPKNQVKNNREIYKLITGFEWTGIESNEVLSKGAYERYRSDCANDLTPNRGVNTVLIKKLNDEKDVDKKKTIATELLERRKKQMRHCIVTKYSDKTVDKKVLGTETMAHINKDDLIAELIFDEYDENDVKSGGKKKRTRKKHTRKKRTRKTKGSRNKKRSTKKRHKHKN